MFSGKSQPTETAVSCVSTWRVTLSLVPSAPVCPIKPQRGRQGRWHRPSAPAERWFPWRKEAWFRSGQQHRDLSEQLADIACSVLVLFGSHRGIESIHLVFWPASTLMQSVFMKITSLSHIQRSYDLNVVFSGNIMTMLLKYICSDIPSSLNI